MKDLEEKHLQYIKHQQELNQARCQTALAFVIPMFVWSIVKYGVFSWSTFGLILLAGMCYIGSKE